MGMIETASRIIARYGQAGTFERPGPSGGDPWNPTPGEPTYHDATVGVLTYDNEHQDGTLIQMNDLRVLVSVEGLNIEPNVSDRLHIGPVAYTIVKVSLLGPDGVPCFYDLQVRP